MFGPKTTIFALALCSLLIATSARAGPTPFEGAWQKRLGWWCGGGLCDGTEPLTDTKLPIVEAVWLRAASGRACGFWHSQAYKLYRGLIVGRRTSNQFRVTYSQEIDFVPAFYEAHTFSDVPLLVPNEYAVLEIVPAGLSVRRFELSGKPNPNSILLHTFSRSKTGDFGPSSVWETQFILQCLAGSNPNIERLRDVKQPLQPLHP